MGNGEFQISDRIRQEWVETLESERRTFYNKVTEQEFQFIVLSKIRSKCNIPQLMERSIYPLPKTPKLIILNDNNGQISILVQVQALALKDLFHHFSLKLQLLHILREITITIESLFHRFGPFVFTDKMLGGNKKREIMAWINESFECNEIQIPLPSSDFSEQQMITQIINLFNKQSSIRLDSSFLHVPPTVFSLFLAKIDQLINQQRSNLQFKKTLPHSQPLYPKYPLSPKTYAKGADPLKFGSCQQNRVDNTQQNKRRQKVPNFLKNIKLQKGSNSKSISTKAIQFFQEGSSVTHNRKTRIDQDCQFIIGKVRSLNYSPQPIKIGNQLNQSCSTNISPLSFGPSSKSNFDSLNFSKHSVQTQSKKKGFPSLSHSHKLVLPLMNSITSKEESRTGTSLITEQIEQDNPVEMTFNNPNVNCSFGALNSFCKSLSESQQFSETNIIKNSHSSTNQIKEAKQHENLSMIIHEDRGSCIFDGKCLSLYDQFSKILL